MRTWSVAEGEVEGRGEAMRGERAGHRPGNARDQFSTLSAQGLGGRVELVKEPRVKEENLHPPVRGRAPWTSSLVCKRGSNGASRTGCA